MRTRKMLGSAVVNNGVYEYSVLATDGAVGGGRGASRGRAPPVAVRSSFVAPRGACCAARMLCCVDRL